MVEKLHAADNLRGVTFGKLVVIGLEKRRTKGGNNRWSCKCECGRVVSRSATTLVNSVGKKQLSCNSGRCANPSKNRNSLVGKRFGKLLVWGRAPNTDKGAQRWYCDCDCGRKRVLRYGTMLRRGESKDCGRKPCNPNGRINLVGKRFGTLTVKERMPSMPFSVVTYLVECDCGVKKKVRSNNLARGITRSCGKGDCRKSLPVKWSRKS